MKNIASIILLFCLQIVCIFGSDFVRDSKPLKRENAFNQSDMKKQEDEKSDKDAKLEVVEVLDIPRVKSFVVNKKEQQVFDKQQLNE